MDCDRRFEFRAVSSTRGVRERDALRRYRYHYLDGWTEKDTRAAMLFGRAFEKALAAFFLRQDASETLFNEWAQYRDLEMQYSTHDNWDRMLQGGMQLLDRFAQEDRVRILQPQTNLQVKILRPLPGDHTFISYVDAIGELDNELCVIDWKTSTSCYPAEPAGLCALDPQMICYSWMTGIERVALVVFVRKRMPEIRLIRQQGVDLDWLDELDLLQFVLSRKELSGFRFTNNGITARGSERLARACLRCLLLFYRNTILSPSDIL